MVRSTRRVTRFLRIFGSGALAIIVGALVMVVAPGTAQAARSCLLNSAGNSYFAGWGHDPGLRTQYFEGASGYIMVRDGRPCSAPSNPSTNFTASWVMIADNQAKGWVQVGFMRRSDLSGVRWFSQSVQRTGYYPDTWISPEAWVTGQVGTNHAFRVLWDPACYYSEGQTYACEKSTIDSTTVAVSTFNPFGNWASPFLPMFFAETKNMASDVTGSAAAKTSFRALGAQKYDDTLTNMTCTMVGRNDNPSRWSTSASSCIAFDSWTAVL
jgi:hypothetical protein